MESLVQSTCTLGAAKVTVRCIEAVAQTLLFTMFAMPFGVFGYLLVGSIYATATRAPVVYLAPITVELADSVCCAILGVAFLIFVVFVHGELNQYIRRAEQDKVSKKD